MKKLLKITITIMLLILTLPIADKVEAAGSLITLIGDSTVTEGSVFDVSVYLSGVTISSASIDVSTTGGLEVVSGGWTTSNTLISNFANNHGDVTLNSATAVSEKIFSISLRALAITNNATVTFNVQLKIGSIDLGTSNETHTVKVTCLNHTYGSWDIVNPTCTEYGYQTRTCSFCGMVQTEYLNPLGHITESMETVKEPTCTETGLKKGVCTRCKKETTQIIPANGHDFNSWICVKNATCVEKGIELRKCNTCGYEETRETEYGEHILGDDVVVIQEATLTKHGIIEGTCTVCGQKTRIESDCYLKDEDTGAEVSCKEGTFLSGTELIIEAIPDKDQRLETVLTALENVYSNYIALNIYALLNGTEVQPNDTLEITLDLPEGFSNNTAIICVSDDGTIEIMKTIVKDGKIIAELSHFSTYAIVDLKTTPNNTSNLVSNAYMYSTIALGFTTILFFVLFLTKKAKTK